MLGSAEYRRHQRPPTILKEGRCIPDKLEFALRKRGPVVRAFEGCPVIDKHLTCHSERSEESPTRFSLSSGLKARGVCPLVGARHAVPLQSAGSAATQPPQLNGGRIP